MFAILFFIQFLKVFKHCLLFCPLLNTVLVWVWFFLELAIVTPSHACIHKLRPTPICIILYLLVINFVHQYHETLLQAPTAILHFSYPE